MRVCLNILLLAAVFYLGCSSRHEDSASVPDLVQLQSEVSRTMIGLSEEFQFSIKLEYAQSMDPLEIPEVGPEIKGLRILEPLVLEPVRTAGRVYKEKIYRLMGDMAGAYTLPSVKIKYAQDAQEKELTTPRIFIEVGTQHAGDGMEDILEIDGLVRSEFSRDFLGLYILLALGLIGLLGFYLYQKIGNDEVVTIKIPAHEWAFQAIQSLRSRDLIARGLSIEFCHQLSRILRGYLKLQQNKLLNVYRLI